MMEEREYQENEDVSVAEADVATSSRDGLFIHSTTKCYESYLKKFCDYFNVPFSKEHGVPRDLLVDVSFSQYFKHLRMSNVSVSYIVYYIL